jgi:hypothetical protein
MNIPWNIYRTHSNICYYTYQASYTDIVLPFLPVMIRDSLATERQDVVVRACGRRATLQACQGRLWRLEDEGIHDELEHRMDLPLFLATCTISFKRWFMSVGGVWFEREATSFLG